MNILEKYDVDKMRAEMRTIEAEMSHSDFWKDNKVAQQKTKRLASLTEKITLLEKYAAGDTSPELIEKLEMDLYLSGPYDQNDAILSIHSGQGGVEAMDWADMLNRMYHRYVESCGWRVEEIDYEPGSEAGIKSVVFEVSGENVYGMLKHEAGVHRLVRQSPYNADHLRQTSFALVEVVPVVKDEEEQKINEDELVWDFFRSGGKGGQNVNKVSSAVRLTHKPSGLIVTSQRERDQSKNREIALKLLKAKLVGLEEEKRKQEMSRIRGTYVTPGWGNQIRSYVLHPYHLVKDTRTQYEETDADSVLNGRLDNFIRSELHFFADGRN